MISLFLSLLLFAQAPSADAIEHMQAGIKAEKAGQHDKAIEEFKMASELDPGFAVAYVDLGNVYMAKKQYAEALQPLRKALSLDPNIMIAEEMLGYSLLRQGYAAEALSWFLKSGDKGAAGIAQLQTGDWTNAIQNLQAGLVQHPDDAELLFGLARVSGILSRHAKDDLLAAHPDSAQAHEALAADYWALQRSSEAEREYRAALEVQPDVPDAHFGLGDIYEKGHQLQQAEEEFAAEAKLRPGSAETAYRLGEVLLEDGKIQEAAGELRRSDALQPEMPQTLFALAKTEALRGQTLEAVKDWNRVLALEKGTELEEKTHFALASAYRKLGKTADAIRETQAFDELKTRVK